MKILVKDWLVYILLFNNEYPILLLVTKLKGNICMNLSSDQEDATSALTKWAMRRVRPNNDPLLDNHITMGGYAGTGKTTLIAELRRRIHKQAPGLNVAFVTFTGKASLVLDTKLQEASVVRNNDYVGTIHRLIYRPIFQKDGKGNEKKIIGWEPRYKGELECDLIIIDEASMVSKKIWDDLIYYEIPIIAIGDHGQLPPIGDAFSLMNNPSMALTEVHRQALNHPIIKLSMHIRKYGFIPHGLFEEDIPLKEQRVFKLSWNNDPMCQRVFNKIKFDDENNDVIALCGMNRTRVGINNLIRNMIGNTENYPYANDKVVCLKNNYDTRIFNGQIGSVAGFVTHFNDELYNMTIDFGYEEMIECMVHKGCFGLDNHSDIFELATSKEAKRALSGTAFKSIDLCDWGYCISVHKSQGSEWDKVILFEERSHHWDDDFYKRWLYTAVTRAKEKLFVITN